MTELEYVNDPRTMDPDALREMVRETYKAMKHAWVFQAAAMRRIHDQKLYEAWSLSSWNEYLASDLPGLDERTVQQMVQGLYYIENHEPLRLEAVLGGGAGPTPQPVPDYDTARRLDSLQEKARHGAVPPEEYEAIHQAAFSGEVSGKEIRRRVAKVAHGIRLIGSSNDPAGDKLRTLSNKLAVAASGVHALRRAVDAGELPFAPGRGIVYSLVEFQKAILHAFGEERFRAIVAEAIGTQPTTHARKALL